MADSPATDGGPPPPAAGPAPQSTALHVSASDVAVSSPFNQPDAAKYASLPLSSSSAAPGQWDAGGPVQDGGKPALDGISEEELAPGLLPKLPWRENPLLTKVQPQCWECGMAAILACPCLQSCCKQTNKLAASLG